MSTFRRFSRGLALAVLLLALTACTITITELQPTPTLGPTNTPAVLVEAPPTSTPQPTGAPPSPTPTITPTPAPPQIPNGPSVNFSDVVVENINNNALDWFKFQIAQDNREPVIGQPLTMDVSLTADQATGLMWDSWWCTADDSLMQGTLVNMEFAYYINGVLLNIEEQGHIYNQYTANGSSCRVTVFYLTDWPTGTHELEYKFIVRQRVSDGFRNYPPADYTTRYTVTVP